MIELAQVVAGWPMAISMAAAVASQGLRAGRRRTALNEALHELRRPLQAVALASGPRFAAAGAGGDAIELAAAALERLDREINGGSPAPAWGTVDGHSLADAAIERWRRRAQLAGASLELRWNAGRAAVSGDRCALAQALDNLIVNAIEHGGPTIVISARRREGRLRIAVADSGRGSRPPSRDRAPAAITRFSGRRRHGHGLAVVRQIVSSHGGRFALRRSERGTLAVLELPLVEVGERLARERRVAL
jgi:signal transduction histidine kinase